MKKKAKKYEIFTKKKINLISSNYFSCFITMVKLENRYIKEFIEYYKKLGINKIFIGDNNSINEENLNDVLKYYITDDFVKIINIRGKIISQNFFFQNTFDKFKSKCNWIAYFDIDEYLEFVDKNKTIKEFLSDNRFKKCEAIKINWLMLNDNEQIYYENKPLKERFTKENYYKNDIRTVKTIVRGNLTKNPWINSACPHEPSRIIKSCDSLGNFCPFNSGIIDPPIYKFCYLKHYSIKSTEEFASKILKGYYGNKFNIDERVDYYFKVNNFSYKKLAVLEKIFNKTFNLIKKN